MILILSSLVLSKQDVVLYSPSLDFIFSLIIKAWHLLTPVAFSQRFLDCMKEIRAECLLLDDGSMREQSSFKNK